jgi:hypothetical protein
MNTTPPEAALGRLPPLGGAAGGPAKPEPLRPRKEFL